LGDQWDLAGLKVFGEGIDFPDGDNFENINFSYADFSQCVFRNATFVQAHFTFTQSISHSGAGFVRWIV
jgi:uncharacterized protein YjbI with pentapeptide repeats